MSEIREFFTYTASVTNLAPSSSQTVNVIIDSDADFTIVKTCFFATLAGDGAQTEESALIPDVRLSIIDTGSGRYFQSAPVPIYSYAGRGKLPYIWPVTKTIKASSTLRFQFDSFAIVGETYATVEIALQGYKTYYSNK